MQKETPVLNYGSWYLPAALLCIIIALPVCILAQQDTSKNLREVKVSSSPVPHLQSITPAQQIVAKDFERYSAFNVADAIRNFTGIILKDYGGIGGLKTVSVRGLSANHTAVIYDGVQLNDAENGQIDLGKLNLNNVQEISLYNGQPPNICMPARSFASASILYIKTVKPALAGIKPYLITAGVKTGSFNLLNPYLQWQQRISKNWSFIVNSYLENANGRYKYKTFGNGADSTHSRTNADISAQQIDGALYWAKSDSNNFNLHINLYNSDRGLPGAVIFYKTSPTRDRLFNNDLFLQTGYEHIWVNGIHLLVNTKVSQMHLRYLNPLFLNAEGKLDQRFTQYEAYQSAALAYHLSPNIKVSYAIDVFANKLNTNLFNFSYPTRINILNVLASNLTVGKFRLQASLLNTNITETVRTGRAAPHLNVY